MKTKCWHLIGYAGLFLALLVSPLLAANKKMGPPPPSPINKLVWLAGNWRMELNGRVIDEQWMIPGGGVMLGMTRTVVKGHMVEHDHRQIRGGPGGTLYYVLQPAGGEEALYQLAAITEGAVTFTNPERDFPQTISYTLTADGVLVAASEGTESDGQAKRIEVAYQRFQPESP